MKNSDLIWSWTINPNQEIRRDACSTLDHFSSGIVDGLGGTGDGLGGTGFQPVSSERLTRRNLPHIQHPGDTYHVVFRVKKGEMPGPARQIALDACLFWNEKKCRVHACAVMPNHVHLLINPSPLPDGTGVHSLAELLHSMKSFSANKINKMPNRKGPFRLDESYDRYIRSETDFEEKFRYIVSNPVKDGLAERPEKYPYLFFQGDSRDGSATPVFSVLKTSSRGGAGFQPLDQENRQDACSTLDSDPLVCVD